MNELRKENKLQYELIARFLSGKRLKSSEFQILDQLFNDKKYNLQISGWLEKKWQQGGSDTVDLQFETIRSKIKKSSSRYQSNRLFIVLSKAAAILFIPILAAALYFYINSINSHELLTLATQKGEQTNVILPDGTEVWLNVDSKLSYPVNFGIKNRNLNLEGEAYFEVAKNEKLPFEVTTSSITTVALGTQFIISAYLDALSIKTSLVEGSVQIMSIGGEDITTLKPGQQFNLNLESSRFKINTFNQEYELGWKNDELVFRLTAFDDVVTKLEKWYDIDIEYNADLFKRETLTVRFEKYETLENVLKVISKANGFKFSIENKHVYIMRE